MEYLLNDVKHAFKKLTLLQAVQRSNGDNLQNDGVGKLMEQAFAQIPDQGYSEVILRCIDQMNKKYNIGLTKEEIYRWIEAQ